MKNNATQVSDKTKSRKGIGGRRTVWTQETEDKLKLAWMTGYTDTEAAHFAEMSPSTLYERLSKDIEFSDKRDRWKANPILKAKAAIVSNLNDPSIAKWYLERKARDEFGARTELTGANGKDLMPKTNLLNVNGNMTLEQLEALGRGLGAVDDQEYDLDP